MKPTLPTAIAAVQPTREEFFGIIRERQPDGFFKNLPVFITPAMGEIVTRTKRWRRRGIGRLPKTKVRIVGRKPALYVMDTARVLLPPVCFSWRYIIIANREGWGLLQRSRP